MLVNYARPDLAHHMGMANQRRHSAFLREHREAKGWNGPEMARRMNEALGVHTWDKSVVARYERRERGLSPDLEDAYAAVYECSIAELYEPPLPADVPNIHKMLREANADHEVWRLIGALTEATLARRRSEGDS